MSQIKAVCAALVLSLCTPCFAQTSGQPLGDVLKKGLSFFSGIFNPRSSQLEKLVDAGNLSDADSFYQKEQTYFDTSKDDQPLLAKLAAAINTQQEPPLTASISQVNAAINGSLEQSQWPAAFVALKSSNDLLQTYDTFAITKKTTFASPKRAELLVAINTLKNKYADSAQDAFLQFDHFSGHNFFTEYPVQLDKARLLNSSGPRLLTLATANADQLATLFRTYQPLISSENKAKLSDLYVAAMLGQQNARTFYDKYRVVAKARELGFVPTHVPNFDVLTVILEDAQSSAAPDDFPSEIDNDLRMHLLPLSRQEALSSADLDQPDYLVVVVPVSNNTNRKVIDSKEVLAKYESGERQVPNPNYVAALAKYDQARQQLATQQIQNITNPPIGAVASLLKGVADGLAQTNVNNAIANLKRTPQTLDEPVYSDYRYRVSTVDIDKRTAYDFFVVDKATGTFTRYSYSKDDQKRFQLGYNFNEHDPNYNAYHSSYSNEDDLNNFEKSKEEIPLSALVNVMASGTPSQEPFTTRASFLTTAAAAAMPAAMASTATSTAPASTSEASLVKDDPRMDSVVIVLNGTGNGLGTGFFVRPNLVLTNYHVVEGSNLAEVKLHDGKDSLGKVVKYDPGVDLALIRIQDSGTPVQFFSGPIPTGQSVDVIGHPKGLTYSVTRGIVSAVRKMPNPFVKGGNDVIYIQTDATINPGNSGGPLYLNDKVIGVNTQKMSAVGIEGIGFAIHYAEVSKFLSDFDVSQQ